MGEAARIADMTNEAEGFVLDEGFKFGKGAGETRNGVVAGTEKGFCGREAEVASDADDKDSTRGEVSGSNDELIPWVQICLWTQGMETRNVLDYG